MTSPQADRLPGPERRQQILDVAREEFVKRGRAGVRVREIAAAAGVNEALLYHYFPSKAALFEASVMQPLEQVVGEITEAAARMVARRPDDGRVDLQHLLTFLIRMLQELGPMLGVVLFSDEADGRSFYLNHLHPVLQHAFRSGRATVAAWAGRELEESMVTALFGICFALAIDHQMREVELDVDHVASTIADLLVFGISGPPA